MPLDELAQKSTIVYRDDEIGVATPDHTTYRFTLDEDTETVLYDPEEESEKAEKVYQLVLSETKYQAEESFQESQTETETESQQKNSPTDTTSNTEWPIEIRKEREVPESLVQNLPQHIENLIQADGYKYYVEEMGGSLQFKKRIVEKWEIYQDGSVVVSVIEDET